MHVALTREKNLTDALLAEILDPKNMTKPHARKS
jgi:hypothetical protein